MNRATTFFISVLFFFSAASTAHAQDGGVPFYESAGVLLDGEAACNGGTCQRKNGDMLSCPTSGGPICDDEQVCICQCLKVGNTYTAANRCVDKDDLEAIASSPMATQRCGP